MMRMEVEYTIWQTQTHVFLRVFSTSSRQIDFFYGYIHIQVNFTDKYHVIYIKGKNQFIVY